MTPPMPSDRPLTPPAEPTLALSVQQPWAWLIVNGFKDIENRDWPTKVRGPVLIHAGKKLDEDALYQLYDDHRDIPIPLLDAFQRGGIVGRVEIVDCVTRSDSEWFTGKFGFVLRNAKPLPFRPVRGMLGFFRPETAHV